jgi:hypothetical protein
LIGRAAPGQRSSVVGRHVIAPAERREPCDSRGAYTVLRAPGGEISTGDSTLSPVRALSIENLVYPQSRRDSRSAVTVEGQGGHKAAPR